MVIKKWKGYDLCPMTGCDSLQMFYGSTFNGCNLAVVHGGWTKRCQIGLQNPENEHNLHLKISPKCKPESHLNQTFMFGFHVSNEKTLVD